MHIGSTVHEIAIAAKTQEKGATRATYLGPMLP